MKPNIVLILADDHGSWALGCAGNSEIRTPNLDRLAVSGMRFENFFCTSPVCSPARASILTGRIPSQHGVHDWIRAGNIDSDGDKAIEYLQGQMAYTDTLAKNGYVCGFSGKWHLGDSVRPQKGFSHWYLHAKGGGPYYNAPMIREGKLYEEEKYVTDAITEDALCFIEAQRDEERPFCLNVHYTAPHSPWDRENHPADIFDSYKDCPFASCPQELPHPNRSRFTFDDSDPKQRHQVLSGYYAAVTAMDSCIGKLLDKLEALGLRENTLVVFMSDNGMNMGHHGIWGKGNGTYPMNMYDTAVKVPAIISRPGHVPQGRVGQHMLSQYDFMPTLLNYLGLENPQAEKLPGVSFAVLLRGGEIQEHEKIVVFDEYGPVRMIRSREWKYVHRYPDGPHELYDLKNDPGERENLIDDSVRRNIVNEMRQEMQEWFDKYADPKADGSREAVIGAGQLDLAGKGLASYSDDEGYLPPGVRSGRTKNSEL